MKRLDARLLNFEMVAYPEIAILSSDKNGIVKHSSRAAGKRRRSCPACRSALQGQAAPLGPGTNAASFTQAGLKATTLIPFKMPQQFIAFYHQRWDGPQNLTIEPLLNVLKLTLEWISNNGE